MVIIFDSVRPAKPSRFPSTPLFPTDRDGNPLRLDRISEADRAWWARVSNAQARDYVVEAPGIDWEALAGESAFVDAHSRGIAF